MLVQMIKERLTIEEALERYTNADLSRARGSRSISIRCMFHDDKKPSFSYKPEENIWRCWGECNTGGDVISLVAKSLTISPGEAIKLLEKDLGLYKMDEEQKKNVQQKVIQLQKRKMIISDFKERYNKTFNELLEIERFLENIIKQIPKKEGAAKDYTSIFHILPYAGHLLDVMAYGDMDKEQDLKIKTQTTVQAEKLLRDLRGYTRWNKKI